MKIQREATYIGDATAKGKKKNEFDQKVFGKDKIKYLIIRFEFLIS